MVTWHGQTSDGQGDDIFSQRFDANGYLIGSPLTVDTVAPTATYSGPVIYHMAYDELTLRGTNLNTLLQTGEDSNTNIKDRLDWSKLSWDFDGNTAQGTIDFGFALSDITSAYVTSDNVLKITLTTTKAAALEGNAAFVGGGAATDTIDVNAGFSKDAAGNVSTTDNAVNLGAFPAWMMPGGSTRQLVAPFVTSGGKLYYYWDYNINGSWDDFVPHNALNNLLNGGFDTYDTQPAGAVKGVNDARTIVQGNYTLVLPTLAELVALYSDPSWNNPSWSMAPGYYWTSTTAGSNHYAYDLSNGNTAAINDASSLYVLFQVL